MVHCFYIRIINRKTELVIPVIWITALKNDRFLWLLFQCRESSWKWQESCTPAWCALTCELTGIGSLGRPNCYRVSIALGCTECMQWHLLKGEVVKGNTNQNHKIEQKWCKRHKEIQAFSISEVESSVKQLWWICQLVSQKTNKLRVPLKWIRRLLIVERKITLPRSATCWKFWDGWMLNSDSKMWYAWMLGFQNWWKRESWADVCLQ